MLPLRQMVAHVPPLYLERLGLDFARSYHPKCYAASEKEAAELISDVTGVEESMQEAMGEVVNIDGGWFVKMYGELDGPHASLDDARAVLDDMIGADKLTKEDVP